MKITYLSGGPRERVLRALVDTQHVVDQVILGDPEIWPRVAKTDALARSLGLDVLYIRREKLSDLTGLLRGKLALSVGFPYVLPPDVVSSADTILNVHGAPLPRYAGARTLNWMLVNGETESSITIHKIDAGIDTGPILYTESFPISPFDTAKSLYRKTLELEPDIVVRSLAKLEENGLALLTPQRATAKPLPNRTPEHSQIDPAKPLLDLMNEIRAADPDDYPAFFTYNGEKICVRLWRPDKIDDDDTL